MKRLLLSLLPLTLAACAAAPDRQEVALAPLDKDTICERESTTGTSLPKTRCRTAEQRRADQAGVQQAEESRRTFQGLTTGK
ncbi:hypothetical protein [Roseateles sp. BYS87W]|uniref:Entry exclusion lipoprotein TrbK n=1 Tax=Pelomonas baiyunensis TaxID=3299026 RepID=A0ABW7H2U6_9BURK